MTRDALDEQVDEEDEPMITILLVSDVAIVREGLRMRLALEVDMTIVGEATTSAQALVQVQRLQPTIVLMDLVLPDMDGIAAIAALRAAHTASAIVILSWQDDTTIRARAQAAGATAFVSKYEEVKTILTMIRHVGQRGR
jgi:DNA-binding NarL/FixJ family response regulator